MNSSLKYKVYENYLDWKEEKWEYLLIFFYFSYIEFYDKMKLVFFCLN